MRKVPVTMAMLPAPSAAPSCPAASPGLVDTGEMEVSYSRWELALLWGGTEGTRILEEVTGTCTTSPRAW